ncbi:hypothetical protein KVR01_012794 [Diaporthe batatas]|uniref:uncharacterized protein n=1 Tax=Diaporthe batatas TaxID=748121 RepID=UPI001D0472B1|nr:uncharacterized protein KVR01_012794 [Diaporthe batatas]KAG8157410.1 hypothetical protein KVR01_012794 [Diaporthe batatas]
MPPSLQIDLPGDGSTSIGAYELGVAAGIVFILWRVGTVIYRLYFHPLAKYPGPKIYAASNIPFQWGTNIGGKLTVESRHLHEKYGPIVRVGPNHLSADGSIAWPQIFQHRPGKTEWPKQVGFYHPGDEKSLIGGTHEHHKRLRRQLNHAFSTESMYEQEPIVMKYLDLWTSKLSQKAQSGEIFNIIPWFNFLSFDIIGDLVFAESFGCIEKGDYHPWVANVFESVPAGGFYRVTKQFPWLGPILRNLGSSAESLKRDAEGRQFASEKALARKAQGESPGGRRDFMTYMLRKNRDGQPGFADQDLALNMPTIITAGSETTATAMSGLTWHLSQPQFRHHYDRLVAEIRGAFASESEIDMKTTARLPYLMATIDEILRMYPPAAQVPPRISPGAELEGEHIPKGTAVTVFQWATYHNPDNFHDPDNFRPERWLPESHELYESVFANDNKKVLHPFSFGTRDCVGKNLALSELRVIISRLLYRFDVELQPGHEDWMKNARTCVVWIKDPLNVKLTERKLIPSV